jgi:tRNA(Phe) wybutosine-synthesizing methylase Tyw3
MDSEKYWLIKKQEIIKALDKSIERAKVDVDTLKTMKEIVEKAKIKTRNTGGD